MSFPSESDLPQMDGALAQNGDAHEPALQEGAADALGGDSAEYAFDVARAQGGEATELAQGGDSAADGAVEAPEPVSEAAEHEVRPQGGTDAEGKAHPQAVAEPQLQELGDDALAPAADLPIRLPTFEGPLDLLLFLIRRNEIDIYDIPIESVTRQYMQVLHSMEELNLEVAGDFFVMAATLMYIKSRMLLPTNEQVAQPQEEEEEADPRWELVQQLLEYKKYKEAALELQTLVEQRQDFLERYYQQEQISDIERELEPADKIELWNTFNKVLRRLSERIVKGEIQDEEISISQSMEYILSAIKTRDSFRFTELLEGKRLTVAFLVSTFLAVLELTRLKRLYIVQDAVFGEIECTRRDNPDDEGADITEEEREEAMAPRRAARERKAALAAAAAGGASLAEGAAALAASGTLQAAGSAALAAGADGQAGDDQGEDDGFVPGEDDFNWADFGGAPVSASEAMADSETTTASEVTAEGEGSVGNDEPQGGEGFADNDEPQYGESAVDAEESEDGDWEDEPESDDDSDDDWDDEPEEDDGFESDEDSSESDADDADESDDDWSDSDDESSDEDWDDESDDDESEEVDSED